MPSFISFIPTPPSHINGFFQLVNVSPSDVVYDLGCGDGRLLFAALEKGVGRAVGVELDPEPLVAARMEAKNRNIEDRITFVQQDLMKVKLSRATIVFAYLCSLAALVLKEKFEKELKPGTRIVMEMFVIPEWKPRCVIERGTDFFLYIMPPKLE